MVGAGAFSAFRGATPPDLVDAWLAASAGTPLADVAVFSGTDQSYNVIAHDRPPYGEASASCSPPIRRSTPAMTSP